MHITDCGNFLEPNVFNCMCLSIVVDNCYYILFLSPSKFSSIIWRFQKWNVTKTKAILLCIWNVLPLLPPECSKNINAEIPSDEVFNLITRSGKGIKLWSHGDWWCSFLVFRFGRVDHGPCPFPVCFSSQWHWHIFVQLGQWGLIAC